MAWYKDPVMITEGRMQYLYDETGRRYLDVSFADSTLFQDRHLCFHILTVLACGKLCC